MYNRSWSVNHARINQSSSESEDREFLEKFFTHGRRKKPFAQMSTFLDMFPIQEHRENAFKQLGLYIEKYC